MWWLACAWAGSESWELSDDTFWAEDGLVHASALGELRVEPGSFVFPVERDGVNVGVVLVGEADWSVRFERVSEARAVANRRVVGEHDDPAELVEVAAGRAPLRLGVDRGLWLGQGVWDEVLPGVDRVTEQDGVLIRRASEGHEEVVVTAHAGIDRARRIAERTLRERTTWMRTHQFDPDAFVQADTWRSDDGDPAVLFDLHTDRAWDRFAGAEDLRVDEGWLAWFQDPAGWLDGSAVETVQARTDVEGRLVTRPVARRRAPLAADGFRVPEHRADLVGAGVTMHYEAEGTGASALGYVVSDLQVQAVGGSIGAVVIDVPHIEQEAFLEAAPLPERFTLDGVQGPDGQPLEVVHLPLVGDQTEGRGRRRTYAVRLPEPLAEGARTVIRVTWTDRHRVAHTLGLESSGSLEQVKRQTYDFGWTSDLYLVVPWVRGSDPTPAPVQLRAGLHASLPSTLRLSMAGAQEEASGPGAVRWWTSTTTTATPVVGLGKWREELDPAAYRMPAVRTLLRRPGGADLAVGIRQLVHLSETVLPAYPMPEIEVAELYDRMNEVGVVLAGGGVVGLHPATELAFRRGMESHTRSLYPHLETFLMAAGLHSHWWSARGRPSDEGLHAAAAHAWASWVVGTAHGEDEEEDWFDVIHQKAGPSNGRIDLPSGPTSGWAGGWVIGRTLPDVVGRETVLRAMDELLRGGGAPTWDGLHDVLADLTGRDLDDVFGTWVDAGLAPDVHADWSVEGSQVAVDLRTDVPFGAIRIPVRAVGDKGVEQDGVVEVVDGKGRASLAWPHAQPPRKLVVDPRKVLLLRHLD
ncbi:MAG: hypothetical protein H6738_25040 [Alphaproteobacteria bacterium]|nr:hypothetical protein [Alphaproteobacteria bacterium]